MCRWPAGYVLVWSPAGAGSRSLSLWLYDSGALFVFMWTKSSRESAKREAELFDMLEKAATNEKGEGRDRDKLGDKLEAFFTRKEEEDEATGLMEEMRKKRGSCTTKKF